MKMKAIYTITLLLLSLSIFSQKGKNGSLSVSTSNVKINEFTALTTNASAGNTTIDVAAGSLNANARFTSTLTAGDLVMIIQMQGALIKLHPYNPWEAYVTDSLYGQIYSYQSCGNYEFAQVKTVISATQIELECGLKYDYSVSGKTQVVRVPRYNSLTVTGTGTLTTDAWNGTIGGVLVAEVDGNTTINGLVTASALGFRGGAPIASGGNNFYPTSYMTGTNNGSEKGEGIGSDRLTNTIDSLGKYCKGAPGNGGGGGNANNCGGGGGGNGGAIASYNGYGVPGAGYAAIWNLEWPGRATVTSSGGGKGGYGTSTTTTANINSVGPNSTAWGSFKRLSAGGFGGRPLDYSTGKIFMGGGGGAGHTTAGQSNGAGACYGGNGGGIVFFLNYGTISGSGSIISNGANGGNAFGTANFTNPQQGIDGAGGAGAGGTIILKSNGAISGITTSANGGNGGNQVKSGSANSEGQGPGGGGSGGYIAGNGSVFTQNVNGGAFGTTNATAFATAFPMNGSTGGDVGTNNQIIAPAFSITASANPTLCANQSATLSATSNDPSATIFWYNAAAGGNSVASGTVYTTPTYTATGTYTVYAGSCLGLYRTPIIITVGSGATITVNSPTICPGQTVTLTASGATTYTWSSGPTSNTISVSPNSTTIYTVNATSGTCLGTKTTTVTVSPQPTVSVANATICSGNSTTLTASGATSYTWASGGQTTSSIVVTPTINTTYTITGSNGACTNTTTASVNVSSTPTLSTSSKTICAGQVATFTVSGATTYTWNPGTITGSTYTTSPASSGTISVLGANGTCTAQVTTSITVTPNPTVSVSSQTICPTQSVTLTASGATTYSWNTGATTNTISVSPSLLTIYTVTGTSSSCSNTKTVSVTVASQPTIAVANASICSGNSTTLTASGATNYTWSPGNQTTSSIVVTPTTNTTYTIAGSNGSCTNTTTASVNITSTPTLVANSVTICPGQTATLTVTGATNYTWNPGSVSGNSYTIAPGTNTTVSIIGANGTCTSSTSASVTIGSGISISVNSATICAGQTTTLTAIGATSYTWDSGSNSSSITVSPTSTTIYTISGTSGICSGINTSTVTVVNQPTISVSSTSICLGSSANLTVSGATSYTWEPGSLSGASISVSPTVSTTYTITGSNGICTNTSTAIVSVTNCASSCSFSLGNDTAFCSPLNYTINGPVGYNTYSWSPGNSTNQNLTITSGGTYTCTATIYSNDLITNGNFSAGNTGFTTSYAVGTGGTWGPVSNAGTYSITTNPNLAHTNFFSFGDHTSGTGNMMVINGASTANTVVWSETISIVPNTNYNFSAWVASTENLTAGDEAQLQFSINGSLVGSVFNAPLTGGNWVNFFTNWNSGANTSATITIVDQNTIGNNDFALDDIFFQQICTHSDEITITENVTPTVTAIASNSVICNGNTTSLIGGGASTYTWSGGITNGTVFSPTVTSTYTVIGASAAGCTNTAVQTITVNSVPTLSVTNASICSGQTATLSVTGANTYTWSNGSNGSSISISPNTTTIITVSGTDVNGCINTSITSATVSVTSTPTISVNSTSVCSGQSATLTATGATNYTWSTSQNGASINVNPTNTTTYSVTGDNGGCSTSTTAVVTVDNTILSTYSIAVSTCPSQTVALFGAGTNSSTTTYTWSNGVNTYSQTVAPINTTTYVVNGSSISGCPALSGTVIVNVNSISASFSGLDNSIMNVGETLSLTNTSTGATSVLWDYCEGTSISNQITIPLSDTGTCCIKLIATNATCSDSITKCVTIIKEAVVIIPNVFTPNGDTKNDLFKIQSSGLKNLNCIIYDRWGLKMYEWDGINGYWDGSTKTGLAPDGTYFYIINYTDLKDKATTEKGYLNLFR